MQVTGGDALSALPIPSSAFRDETVGLQLVVDKRILKEHNTVLPISGDVAQLGEHHVRNVGAEGSNPFISTRKV